MICVNIRGVDTKELSCICTWEGRDLVCDDSVFHLCRYHALPCPIFFDIFCLLSYGGHAVTNQINA
jgi:hypothetical protein